MNIHESRRNAIRVDLQIIADMIESGSRVLDVGCGDGTLLDYLTHFKQVDGRGIEISTEGVNICVSHGLSVIQGDADTDLRYYPDNAFDYVVLSQTIQATFNPKEVLANLVRIGRHAIISFPNFAHWRLRWYLLTKGRMPVNPSLPDQWYETPNIHFCSIKDFVEMCREMDVHIEKSIALDHDGTRRKVLGGLFSANLLGQQAVFLLRK